MQFRVIVVTDHKQTHKQTGAITIHCAAALLAHSIKTYAKREQTEPGLVTFHNIRPENRAGLFFQTRSPHRAFSCGHNKFLTAGRFSA